MPKYFLFDPRFQLERENVETVIAPCVKHAENPLTIDGKTPWCKDNGYFSIWREADSGGFRGIFSEGHGLGVGRPGWYRSMRSPDGLAWESFGKPLFTIATAMMRDPVDADPLRRYKAIFTAFAFRGVNDGLNEFGMFSASSPDGLEWNEFHPIVMHHNKPGVPHWQPGTPYWVGGDNCPCLLWAPALGKYVALVRTNIERGPGKRRERAVGRFESADFRTWSPHELVLRNDPDAPNTVNRGMHDIHGIQVWPVGDVYLGIIEPYYWNKADDRMHMELVWSPDTVHWERLCPGQDFVPHPDPGAPDGGCHFPACRPVETGDEVRVYYGSDSMRFLDPQRSKRVSSLFLATFRRDRFAGAAACGAEAGRIVTRALPWGAGLTVNADASRGSLRAELQSESGPPVAGFTFAESTPVTGDALDAPLAWQGRAALPKGPCRIAFELKNVTLYAVISETLRRLA